MVFPQYVLSYDFWDKFLKKSIFYIHYICKVCLHYVLPCVLGDSAYLTLIFHIQYRKEDWHWRGSGEGIMNYLDVKLQIAFPSYSGSTQRTIVPNFSHMNCVKSLVESTSYGICFHTVDNYFLSFKYIECSTKSAFMWSFTLLSSKGLFPHSGNCFSYQSTSIFPPHELLPCDPSL